jgi:hypothetical protein
MKLWCPGDNVELWLMKAPEDIWADDYIGNGAHEYCEKHHLQHIHMKKGEYGVVVRDSYIRDGNRFFGSRGWTLSELKKFTHDHNDIFNEESQIVKIMEEKNDYAGHRLWFEDLAQVELLPLDISFAEVMKKVGGADIGGD